MAPVLTLKKYQSMVCTPNSSVKDEVIPWMHRPRDAPRTTSSSSCPWMRMAGGLKPIEN